MTKREFWLRLFSENRVALAAAIHLCERFASPEQLVSGKDFLKEKVAELDEPVSQEAVNKIFNNK